MDPHWGRVEELFYSALEQPDAEREAWLAAQDGLDAEIRDEVRSLLAADRKSSELSSQAPSPREDAGAVGPRPSRRFGAWETGELLGRGGMGEVYLARRADGQHAQRAALKLMTQSLLSPDGMDRFRREREILAQLEHPNVARLLDGGVSESGEPYLVMEYVDGVRLDRYCERRELSIEARLRLFLTLCAAVASAHRSLVLHRDIKPGNVLVTEDGTLKLVDFGTARRMDAGALETVAAPLTPSFASPEQLRGEPVTTLSDVYGLGMTLYQLLSGSLPFGGGGKSAYETAQQVVEGVSAPPSTAPGLCPARRRELRGDLDNIVLKAIAPDPARRYASAESLAADVERYLNRRPVQARAGNWAYRTERFVARHRLAVALSILLALTVSAAAVVLSVQSRQAREEAERSRHLADFLTHVMGLGYDRYSGPLRCDGASAREIDVVRYAADRLQAEMAGQAELEAQVRANIGHALEELGDTAAAEVNLRRGLALVDARRNPALAAELTAYLARNRALEGDSKSAEPLYHQALRLLDAAGSAMPAAVESVVEVNAAASVSSPAESEALLERALRRARQVGEASPVYALVLLNRGVLRWDLGRAEEGSRDIAAAMAIEDAIHPRPIEACFARQLLGQREMSRGNLRAAGRLLDESLPCMERAFLPGSLPLMWARLAGLKLLVQEGRGREAAGPLAALAGDIAERLPKAHDLLADALAWRDKALRESGSAPGSDYRERASAKGPERFSARASR